jgi:hypothetical protein
MTATVVHGRTAWTPGMSSTPCPDCGSTADVTREGYLTSTSGPIAMVRVVCQHRHWFLMPEDSLARAVAPDTADGPA